MNLQRAFLSAIHRSMLLLRLRKVAKLLVLQVSMGKVQHSLRAKIAAPGERWVKAVPGSKSSRVTYLETTSLIGYSLFQGALVAANPRYSAIIRQSKFVMAPGPPSRQERIITSIPPVSGLLRSDRDSLLVKLRADENLPEAVYVGSLSPHNWYHWVIDFLPSVFLMRQLPQQYARLPLLVPQAALEKAHWREILEAVSEGRQLIPMAPEAYKNVHRLVWIHGPTVRFPGNSAANAGELAMETSTMNDYRRFIVDKFKLRFDSRSAGNRVFLDRPSKSLRSYNQEEIMGIASEYGFVPLNADRRPLRETINILLNAEYIIGPHGAGWANALFAEQARASLIWTWDEAIRENWFHNVLQTRGIPTTTITTGPGSNSSAYSLDPSFFLKALKGILS